MSAPFPRGTKLDYIGPHYVHAPCKYVGWWGRERSSLIDIKFEDGSVATVHIDDVRVRK